MGKKKIIKLITIIGIVIGTVLLIWYLILNPLIDFHSKETEMTDAGKKYFEKNPAMNPDEGEISTVTLRTLLKQKYLVTMTTTYGKKSCNLDESWVKVLRKEGKYTYYTNLVCGSMKSTIDNEGPVIKLTGDSEIEIEKGTEYKDLGIESVYDDTDGKMKKDSVTIKGKVDTSKIGTYTITYSAYDSLENKSEIQRIIKVVQTLNKTIKKDTDKTNIYKGSNPNNYIEFSNMLFRIVGLNSDGTVKIVSAEPIGTVNHDDINKWLNEYFYNHLTKKAKKYIVETEYCSSKIKKGSETTTTACDKKTKQNVGILSIKDYNASVDGTSYLYPINVAWTSDYENDKNSWITSELLVDDDYNYVNYLPIDKEYNFALYPAVTLEKNIKLTSGDGTEENPYKFSKIASAKAGDLVNTRYTGEYVSYGNTIYRIIDTDGDNTKVISNNIIGTTRVSLSTNDIKVYNPKDKENVGYYIENKLSKLIKTDIFIKKNIEVPIYNKLATYSGKKTIKKYSVKLAAPNMYEMFSGASGQTSSAYWLINSSKQKETNYFVSDNDTIYYGNTSAASEKGVRITGHLEKDASIVSGKGTINSPYILQK